MYISIVDINYRISEVWSYSSIMSYQVPQIFCSSLYPIYSWLPYSGYSFASMVSIADDDDDDDIAVENNNADADTFFGRFVRNRAKVSRQRRSR